MRENLKVYYTEEVHDSSGKRIFYRRRRSHSFTQQFLKMLSICMNHAYNTAPVQENITDTGNAARVFPYTAQHSIGRDHAAEAPGGTVTYGLVFGTGTNAEAATDYALQTQIAEGAGAGQMNYGGTALTTATQAGGITSFTIVRAGGNNSGGQITVEEAALYVSMDDSAGTQRYFCWLRDLTGGTPVNNGQTYTGTYTIQTSI